jgi:hypothetical protein
MRIAEPAIAAAREHRALTDFGEIGKQRFRVLRIDLRAHWHFQDHVSAICAVPVLAHSSGAILGFEMLLVAIIDERVETFDGLRNHVAASAAISAIRPAELNEFLTAERDAAVPAIAGADVDLCFIEKFHGKRNMRSPMPN